MSEHTEVEKLKTVVEKEKNPMRVGSGKAHAEKNRKYKEHFEKTGGVTKTEPTVSTEPKFSDNSTYFVIAALVLGVAGFAYYQSQQKPKVDAKVAIEKPNAVAKAIAKSVVAAKLNRLITV